jgi:methionyl-tRNA synthetase
VVNEANRFVSATRPWELAKAERSGDGAVTTRLDAIVAVLLTACQAIAEELRPFLPDAATRIERALQRRDAELGRTLFAKQQLNSPRGRRAGS